MSSVANVAIVSLRSGAAAPRTISRVSKRPALTGLPIPSCSRPFSATQSSCNSTPFTLDKAIFNQSLYKQIQTSFFQGHDLTAKQVSPEVVQRWFGSSADFDTICRQQFEPALKAIGPEKFPKPSAEPFLRELKEVAEENRGGDGAVVAWTALSMALLLDQVPRNIYRTKDGLVRVYNHYDSIACPLMLTLLSPDSPIGRPDLHPQWRRSMAHRMWFYLPLMHSEELAHHDLQRDVTKTLYDELVQEGADEASLGIVKAGMRAEEEHREILDKFGRYCHRNQALGRQSTREEDEFLAKGGATFGVAQDKAE